MRGYAHHFPGVSGYTLTCIIKQALQQLLLSVIIFEMSSAVSPDEHDEGSVYLNLLESSPLKH